MYWHWKLCMGIYQGCRGSWLQSWSKISHNQNCTLFIREAFVTNHAGEFESNPSCHFLRCLSAHIKEGFHEVDYFSDFRCQTEKFEGWNLTGVKNVVGVKVGSAQQFQARYKQWKKKNKPKQKNCAYWATATWDIRCKIQSCNASFWIHTGLTWRLFRSQQTKYSYWKLKLDLLVPSPAFSNLFFPNDGPNLRTVPLSDHLHWLKLKNLHSPWHNWADVKKSKSLWEQNRAQTMQPESWAK